MKSHLLKYIPPLGVFWILLQKKHFWGGGVPLQTTSTFNKKHDLTSKPTNTGPVHAEDVPGATMGSRTIPRPVNVNEKSSFSEVGVEASDVVGIHFP